MFPSHIGSRSTQHSLTINSPHLASFPSHIGSRSTSFTVGLLRRRCSFHPTLVLAQLKISSNPSHKSPEFPSHIGSRSTCSHYRASIINFVSIPHWFSLNMIPSHTSTIPLSSFHPTLVLAQPTTDMPAYSAWHGCFHPTLVLAQPDGRPARPPICRTVSIPHWFSLNSHRRGPAPWERVVSIPHWFSLNKEDNMTRAEKTLAFPSHIGSRSTRGQFIITKWLLTVSIPHWFSLNNIRDRFWEGYWIPFPSHIGSRSTQKCETSPPLWHGVSIPHWFSLNIQDCLLQDTPL